MKYGQKFSAYTSNWGQIVLLIRLFRVRSLQRRFGIQPSDGAIVAKVACRSKSTRNPGRVLLLSARPSFHIPPPTPVSTNSNCWVSFWENDDYSGDTHTFSGPQNVRDLSEYNYDGSRSDMKNSINSLKTGSSTWLCLFSEPGYDSDILKVGPNTNIADLEDKDAPGIGDWQNTIASFIMYDTCPDFWNTSDGGKTGDCWVKMYTGKRFTGTCYALYGAGEVVNNGLIDNYRKWEPVQGAHGDSLIYAYTYYYPKSLTTGASTWVELYDDLDYEKLICQFGPNSLVSDLSKYGSTSALSMKVFSAPPSGFSTSSQTPNEVLAMEQFQTSEALESILVGAVKMIPTVGSLIGGIVQALWPSGTNVQEIWDDMDQYMDAMVRGLIAENNREMLYGKLTSYGDDLATYNQMAPGGQKATKLADILDDLGDDKTYFLNPQYPEQNLTYLIAFGTISVVMAAERAYNYAILSGGMEDENPALALSKLDEAITTLTQAANDAAAAALQWRTSQLTVSSSYVVTDAYSGYSMEYSTQADANSALQELTNYVSAQYSAQLAAYINPSNVWGYFHTTNTEVVEGGGGANFPNRVFLTIPETQLVTVSVGSYPDCASGPSFQENLNGGQITGVTLYSTESNFGGYVSGIQFSYSNQSSVRHGNTGPSIRSVQLASDEYIVALYGGSGGYVDQLYFRTNKGRDFGLGGSGGTEFYATAPQGVAATLASVQGINSNYLYRLLLNWQYETVPAYVVPSTAAAVGSALTLASENV